MIKTTKPGKHQQTKEYYSYQKNNKLREYTRRTELIRENIEDQPSRLILSYVYTHKPVKYTTISRYVKLFLWQEGIDLTIFSPHLISSVLTSKGNIWS